MLRARQMMAGSAFLHLSLLACLLPFASAISKVADEDLRSGAMLSSPPMFQAYVDFDKSSSTKMPDSFLVYFNDTTFHQLMQNLMSYGSKGSIVFRAMGIPKKKFSNWYWTHLAKGSQAFSSKFLLQLPMKITNNASEEFDSERYYGTEMIKMATEALGVDKIVGFNLGNEPDWDVSNVEEAVGDLLREKFGTCRMLAGPESANYWSSFKSKSRMKKFMARHECVGTIATHHYTGSSKDPTYTFKDLLSTKILFGAQATADVTSRLKDLLSTKIFYSAQATAKELAPVAKEHGADYRVTEIGSMFGGGRWGMSDRFAATMWLLDVSLSLVHLGAEGVNFNGYKCGANAVVNYGECKLQAGFESLPSSMRGSNLYYGMLMFQRAVGSGAYLHQALMSDKDVDASVWALRPLSPLSRQRRVVVINRQINASGFVSVVITGDFWESATLCRLVASTEPHENATADAVSMCGQQLKPNGQLSPASAVLEEIRGVPLELGGDKPVMAYTFWMDVVSAVLLEVKIRPNEELNERVRRDAHMKSAQ
eukprot:gene7387-510_t